MTSIFLFLQLHGPDILHALSSIIAGASVLANFTPTDRDNRAVGFFGNAVHFLAANFFALNIRPPTVNQ